MSANTRAEDPAEKEAPDNRPAPPRTLGDVYLDNLKISIRCTECGEREAHYPQDMPGFPDQPVDSLVRRRLCQCASTSFEVREVWWCDGLVKKD